MVAANILCCCCCAAMLVYFSVRDWTRICYVIGFKNIGIHLSTRYRILSGLIVFPLWRADESEQKTYPENMLLIQACSVTCVRSLSKPLRARQRERHQTKGLLNKWIKQWLCTCVFYLCTFLCRPLQQGTWNDKFCAVWGTQTATADFLDFHLEVSTVFAYLAWARF